MGCFSFKCQKCGRGIQSSSFSGQRCKLFLLKDGEVIQQMEGEYDSSGRTFIDGTQSKEVKHDLRESHEWQKVFPDNDRDAWSDVCNLMFSEEFGNGIAAFHEECYSGEIPTVRSQSDPNQGWGDDDDEECLMGDTRGEGSEYPKPRQIPGYDVLTDLKTERLLEKKWRAKHDLEFAEKMLAIDPEDRYYKKSVELCKEILADIQKEMDELNAG